MYLHRHAHTSTHRNMCLCSHTHSHICKHTFTPIVAHTCFVAMTFPVPQAPHTHGRERSHTCTHVCLCTFHWARLLPGSVSPFLFPFPQCPLAPTSPHACFLLCRDSSEGHRAPLCLSLCTCHTCMLPSPCMPACSHECMTQFSANVCVYACACTLCPYIDACLFTHMPCEPGCSPCCWTLAAPRVEGSLAR